MTSLDVNGTINFLTPGALSDSHRRSSGVTHNFVVEDVCGRCGYGGGDVKVVNCGCILHARCLPLPPPSVPLTHCPECRQPAECLTLLPMSDSEIVFPEDMIDFESSASSSSKRKIALEGVDELDHRTGRWSTEETVYADALIAKFESGHLPLKDGTRLNDFLARMLSSSKSRLTKKMKHSKLNSKAFKHTTGYLSDPVDAAQFSALEEAFFESVLRRHEKINIKFHVQKQWRECFSSFCWSTGQPLDGDAWLRSVADIERRVSEAKDKARMTRRKMMMGKALAQDTQNPNPGVVITKGDVSGNELRLPDDHSSGYGSGVDSSISTQANVNARACARAGDHPQDAGYSSDGEFLSFIKDKIIWDDNLSHDFCDEADNDDDEPTTNGSSRVVASPFLNEVLAYIGKRREFEHVDLWVPTFVPPTRCGDHENVFRLCFAGSATAHWTPNAQRFKFEAFGEYSTRFSFNVGCGLPGRSFQTGKPIWEQNVQSVPFEIFERRGGAVQYGVRTAVAFPIPSVNVGLSIVVLYSSSDLLKNESIMNLYQQKLCELVPIPSWKIVVDVGHAEAAQLRSPDKYAALPTPHYTAEKSSTTGRHHPVSSKDLLKEVLNIMGKHMPSDPTSPLSPYLQGFMSVRLLILKEPKSDVEERVLNTLLGSYSAYMAAGRSTSDIAFLLARDFMFLMKPT